LIQTLTKNWWLLVLCGVVEAIMSVVYLIIYNTTPDTYGGNGIEVFVNRLTLAAGACTIAAGIWRSVRGISWLLVLNGLALTAYGWMALFWHGPLSFRFFALLVVVMAISFGMLALAIARTPRRRVADNWFFGLAGTASIGVALAFLALASHWIQLERRLFHPSVFLWFCSYFGFSALCMLGLALRLHRISPTQSAPRENLSKLGNPKPAH
jgi:uncharacterized membrane protein HdeD (DUF308 family)